MISQPAFFLLDEHIPAYLGDELVRVEPAINFFRLGDEKAPPLGTQDPQLLVWAENSGATIISMDKRTMGYHLRQHFEAGKQTWGVILLR